MKPCLFFLILLNCSIIFAGPETPVASEKTKALVLQTPCLKHKTAQSEIDNKNDRPDTFLSPNTDKDYDDLKDLFHLYQPYLANITAYKPMYFLVGTDPSKTKFQISLKYQFFRKENQLAMDHPWLTDFHFGYTQTSFWDLSSNSAPFEDTNYQPEFFFLSSNLGYHPFNAKGIFIQSGLRHESNGRGGDVSRSTNTVYFKPILVYYDEDSQIGLQVSPEVWMYIRNDNETNPDLDDYRGYFNLQIKAGKADGFVLDSTCKWANEGASFKTDLTYPMHRLLTNSFDIYLHIQYTNTIAESLLHYRSRTEALRIGLSIVR